MTSDLSVGIQVQKVSNGRDLTAGPPRAP
jgi:hypothetical protein